MRLRKCTRNTSVRLRRIYFSLRYGPRVWLSSDVIAAKSRRRDGEECGELTGDVGVQCGELEEAKSVSHC